MKPKFVVGYEIDKVVKCVKCHQKMYIPKGWVNTLRSAGSGPAQDGIRCRQCGSYICGVCEPALYRNEFRCCQAGVKEAICYFSSSAVKASQDAESEQAKKGQPPIHISEEDRDKKRTEWLEKAKELTEEGQYEKAFEYFDRVIGANLDTNGYACYLKGCALMKVDRYEEAAECLKDALEADPEGDRYRFELGRVLYELGRWEEAYSAFEKIARGSHIFGLGDKAKEWLQKLKKQKSTGKNK